jgi:hypothetical protein
VRAEAAAADAAIHRIRRAGMDRAGQFKSAEAMRDFHAALDAKRRADARAPRLAAFNARLRAFLDRRCRPSPPPPLERAHARRPDDCQPGQPVWAQRA